MPLRTLLLRRRYWERQRERRERSAKGVRYQYRITPPPDIIDYWGHIPATKPEKFIFAELIRRGVSFAFSYVFGDMPFTADKEERYRPDFLLMDYRIIIEVAGIYWHTRPGMFEYDVVDISPTVVNFNYGVLALHVNLPLPGSRNCQNEMSPASTGDAGK